MNSTPAPESSYYEVSLTHRQVVGALAILLLCVLAAFLSGVWLGREGASGREAQAASNAEDATVPIERLTFFESIAPARPRDLVQVKPTGHDTSSSGAPPSLSQVSPESGDRTPLSRSETPKPHPELSREVPVPEASGGESSSLAGDSVRPAPATESGPFFVQVFSSPNEARARELLSRLRRAKFSVVLLEPREPGGNFRVRVGPYGNREKAEVAARRLQRDHRLQTWITDQP